MTTAFQAGSLWDFSLRHYPRDGVADACLLLQDAMGADVNLLLFAAQLGARGVPLNANRARAAREAAGPWHDAVVRPLRAVRRSLKDHPGPVPHADAEALRARVKAAELEAERLEQSALDALGSGWPADATPGPGLAGANLKALLGTPNGVGITEAVARIAALATPDG